MCPLLRRVPAEPHGMIPSLRTGEPLRAHPDHPGSYDRCSAASSSASSACSSDPERDGAARAGAAGRGRPRTASRPTPRRPAPPARRPPGSRRVHRVQPVGVVLGLLCGGPPARAARRRPTPPAPSARTRTTAPCRPGAGPRPPPAPRPGRGRSRGRGPRWPARRSRRAGPGPRRGSRPAPPRRRCRARWRRPGPPGTVPRLSTSHGRRRAVTVTGPAGAGGTESGRSLLLPAGTQPRSTSRALPSARTRGTSTS